MGANNKPWAEGRGKSPEPPSHCGGGDQRILVLKKASEAGIHKMAFDTTRLNKCVRLRISRERIFGRHQGEATVLQGQKRITRQLSNHWKGKL